jgi:hypothetical protein
LYLIGSCHSERNKQNFIWKQNYSYFWIY